MTKLDLDAIEARRRQFGWTDPEQADIVAQLKLYDIPALIARVRELEANKISTIPCCSCGNEVIEFTVPNDIWNFVMRPDGKETDKEYLCLDCWYKALRNKLRELEAENERLREAQRWIPVSERLPEECVCVIGWEPNTGVRLVYNAFDDMDDVTYWIPLPAGPEGE